MAVENLITAHLDIWTSAIKTKSAAGRGSSKKLELVGVKKLRELILELAVRGKLVPQDPSDEPASELLKKIASEKAKLISEKIIRKQKDLPTISEDELAFEVPKGWVWARLGNVCKKITDGSHNPPRDSGEGYPMLSSQNVNYGTIDFSSPSRYVTEEGFISEDLRTNIQPLDVLLNIVASIGRTAVVPEDAPKFVLQRSVAVLSTSLDSYYFSKLLVSPLCLNYYNKHAKGTAQKGIYLGKLSLMPLAIPPINEQHRIVAKVDELMTLCDQLEAQTEASIDAHKTLVEVLLATLTDAKDADELFEAWQRLSQHFDVLFTTQDAISQLKQTILQLAVMGKLVKQDPNDELASKLLERIAAEKQQLIKDGKIKKQKLLPPIKDEEKPFELPHGWDWAKLSVITTGMDSGWSPACLANSSPSEDVWGVLKTTAVQVMEYLEFENKELPEKLKPRPVAEVKTGDILFTRAGPMNRVGISCLVQNTRPKLMISDKIIRFHPMEIGIYGRFIALCLNAGATAAYLEDAKSGMAASQVNITQEKLAAAPIPLAPLAQQHRIVTKVDELMALCDSLKERLNQAQTTQLHLTDAIVEQTL
jgi:type I restriction enzyme S subunit